MRSAKLEEARASTHVRKTCPARPKPFRSSVHTFISYDKLGLGIGTTINGSTVIISVFMNIAER